MQRGLNLFSSFSKSEQCLFPLSDIAPESCSEEPWELLDTAHSSKRVTSPGGCPLSQVLGFGDSPFTLLHRKESLQYGKIITKTTGETKCFSICCIRSPSSGLLCSHEPKPWACPFSRGLATYVPPPALEVSICMPAFFTWRNKSVLMGQQSLRRKHQSQPTPPCRIVDDIRWDLQACAATLGMNQSSLKLNNFVM